MYMDRLLFCVRFLLVKGLVCGVDWFVFLV